MKYALYFNANSKYDKKADEIIIMYRKRSVGLIEWIKKRPEEQRIIIDISNYDGNILDDIDIFKAVQEVHPYIAIKLYQEEDIYSVFKENNIDYFFIEFADTWDKLHSYLHQGVSDVYITNEFAFNMIDISKVCHLNSTMIRVYPNIAQTSARKTSTIDSLTKFFIRPEDVMFYEPYVDVFEFYCPIKQQDVYMEIYQRQSWTTNLSFIIKEFDKDVISAQLTRFGSTRLNCGKTCAHGACSVCKRALDLSTLLNDLNIGLKRNVPISHYTPKEAYEALRELSYIKESEEEVEKVLETLTDTSEDLTGEIDD